MNEASRAAIAHVNRELAMMEARDEALKLAPRSLRRRTGSSVVFSVRLDPSELRVLETRALMAEIKPSVLARNLIRLGLAAPYGDKLAAAVDQLEAAVAELRSAVP